jgi:hypothetical protein
MTKDVQRIVCISLLPLVQVQAAPFIEVPGKEFRVSLTSRCNHQQAPLVESALLIAQQNILHH